MKATVILLTYEHEKFIAQAIEGVLMQETEFEFELIITEDYSRDRTREIILDYQKRHPEKIRLLLSPHNLYSHEVFTRAVAVARGKYVAMLDGDDYWTSPHKLQKQVDFLDSNPDFAICFHNVLLVYENGCREPALFNSPEQKIVSTITDLLRSNFMATASVMFRRGLFRDFPPGYYRLPFGDWPLHVYNAAEGKIGYLSETLGVYRQHGGGHWSNIDSSELWAARFPFYDHVNRYLEYRYDRIIRHHVAQVSLELARVYEYRSEFNLARKYLRRSFVALPYPWKMYSARLGLIFRLYVRGMVRRLRSLKGRLLALARIAHL
jgi:glycosyltransferase involved in cell wall biosynthesis